MENSNAIIASLGGLSYFGVLILAFLSNMFIPVPEEIILVVMGYLSGNGLFLYPLVMGLFVLGLMISDYMLYSLTLRGSRLVRGFIKRLQKRGLLKNEGYTRRHIKKIIFFSRFLVYLRFIGPVMSGYLKIDRKTFLTHNFLALVVYVNIFLGLGHHFHKQIEIITEGVARFKNYLLTGLLIIFTIVVLKYIQKNFISWLHRIGEFIPTIIPGLEMKEPEPVRKKKKLK
jgi:membrane protein DedA with SNARE-associated domain